MRINKFIGYAALIIIGILLIAAIRGCRNEKNKNIEIVNFKEQIKKHKADSIEQFKAKEAYRDSMGFIQGQWDLSKNRELALNENLGKANDRITILLRKHVPIKPSSDTSVTTVPNEFINDCADCFHELENGRDSVLKYKAEKDNQEQLLLGKINVKDNRISFLEKSNAQLGQSNSVLLSSAKEMQDKWKPRGRLYLSWGVLWSPWPVGAGGGLMYQNKRNVMFGLKGYYGIPRFEKTAKTTVETTVNFPLSLRF